MSADEYTPTTERVRAFYEFDERDRWDSKRGVAFDRWLTAHDAEIRAEPGTAITLHAYTSADLDVIRAEAWDEGQGAGTVAALNFTPLEPNPYRKEASA